MAVVIIKTFVYIIALLILFRFILWAACEYEKYDSIDGMNYWDLKHEIQELQKRHMEREKRRSMKGE